MIFKVTPYTLVRHRCSCGTAVYCDDPNRLYPKKCHHCGQETMRPLRPFQFHPSVRRFYEARERAAA